MLLHAPPTSFSHRYTFLIATPNLQVESSSSSTIYATQIRDLSRARANMEDDVSADKTPGFKVGEKKTLDEYHKLGE